MGPPSHQLSRWCLSTQSDLRPNLRWLAADPTELCDRKFFWWKKKSQEKNLTQLKQIIAITDKILEYKRISVKQHTILNDKFSG